MPSARWYVSWSLDPPHHLWDPRPIPATPSLAPCSLPRSPREVGRSKPRVPQLRTHRIPSSAFHRLEGGVELTFAHPPWFVTDGTGYVLVCLPWLSKFEWHAFSLFSHPTKPHHSCVCMAVGGDWTRRLHEVVQRPTRRPVWISGPFASPYATAAEYDNLVLVATGIGITPAMSIITTYPLPPFLCYPSPPRPTTHRN